MGVISKNLTQQKFRIPLKGNLERDLNFLQEIRYQEQVSEIFVFKAHGIFHRICSFMIWFHPAYCCERNFL